MKKYDSYKDSGIEWIGEIPSHWEIKKLNWCFELIGSGTTPKADNLLYYLDGDTNWLLTGDLNDGEIFDTSKKITQKAIDDHSTLKVYPTESIVMAMYGATIGKLGVLKIETTVNQACCVLSKPLHLNYKFAFYILLSARTEIINMSYGGGQPNISQELIKSFRVQIPNIEEQTSIANFLDLKTSEIDEIITNKKRLLELYEEEKTAIINQAVTKGLDPNVSMKDSGIEWLGKIPEHWEVKKLKYIILNKLMYGANESAEEENKDNPRYIRITDIGNDGKLIDETFKSLPPEKAEDFLLTEGDILFARSGATVGKTYHFKNYNGKACFAGYLIKASSNKDIISSDFLYLFTKSGAYESWKGSIFNQATIQNIGADKYAYLDVPLPPLNEQQSIVHYIESECSKIDFKKARTEELIELLTEYRTTLISEAVTGKIKVTENCENNKGASQYHQDH